MSQGRSRKRGERNEPFGHSSEETGFPLLLTADDIADLLRTSRRAVYIAAARAEIPGVLRVGRRLLFRRDEVFAWLGLSESGNQKRKGKRP